MDDNYINKFVECYTKKCKNEVKKRKSLRDKMFKNSAIIFNEYENKVIDKNELIKKITKLNKKYANDIKDLYQCQLDKCNDLTKIKIEELIKKITYTKKDNYSIKDYLKIIELHDKYSLDLFINETKK